jgi:hypothetical protein
MVVRNSMFMRVLPLWPLWFSFWLHIGSMFMRM